MNARPSLIAPGKPIKLVVWDLDHTLWHGVLMESAELRPNPELSKIIVKLDELGVLQSIASRNDSAMAEEYLRRLGIFDYFLAPQINWAAKSSSVAAIAAALNIGLDSVLFVDDQDFELEEVRFACPEVRTLNALRAAELLNDPLIQPEHLTDDARNRRVRYIEEESRARTEQEFQGTPEQFLSSLDLELTINRACAADLDRAAELVARTNQLNSSGIIYSKSDLRTFLDSPAHTLLVADLKDRFGNYGRIAVALLETATNLWTLKLILVSCRVLSRGIGPVLLNYLAQRADAAKANLRVEFRDTGRNRPMKIALMMAGFTRRDVSSEIVHVYREGEPCTTPPPYIKIISSW